MFCCCYSFRLQSVLLSRLEVVLANQKWRRMLVVFRKRKAAGIFVLLQKSSTLVNSLERQSWMFQTLGSELHFDLVCCLVETGPRVVFCDLLLSSVFVYGSACALHWLHTRIKVVCCKQLMTEHCLCKSNNVLHRTYFINELNVITSQRQSKNNTNWYWLLIHKSFFTFTKMYILIK